MLSVAAYGQNAGTGALAGVVTDSSGAVVAGANVKVTNNLTGETRIIDTTLPDSPTGGHWDGDINVLRAFTYAVATGDTSRILSGARETLETHLTVFAAEQSRHEGRTVEVIV